MYIKYDLQNSFFVYFQIFNSVKKICFTGMIIFIFSQPIICVSLIIIQQTLWVLLYSFNRIKQRPLSNFFTVFGEFQLLVN